MVCKEEVLLWFKDLDSYKRIDVLYELLNMCLPFELRFIGSCIEELGKHTFQELRGPSLTANDLEKLSKDASLNQGILEEGVRHRVLIYLSLLSSRNYSVATWLYRKLLRTEYSEEHLLRDTAKDETLTSEFLLLFTMALHHPAFTFEQKQFFSKLLAALIELRENRISAKHSALGYPPGFGYPTQKVHDASTIPVKSAPTSCGDSPATTFQQPPGLSHLPPPPPLLDFVSPLWSRPGFPYGAPEVPPFPTATMSPLVSRTTSPSQSRSTSPHRTPLSTRPIPPPPPNIMPLPMHDQKIPPPPLQQPPPQSTVGVPATPTTQPVVVSGVIQPPPQVVPGTAPLLNGPPPPPVVDSISSLPAQLTPVLEQLSHSSLPPPPPAVFSVAAVVAPPPPVPSAPPLDDDPTKLNMDEKHLLWPLPAINPDIKPNGLRYSPFIGKVRPYLGEQMPPMILDGENSLHQSNSSGNSSPNDTPPGTPSNTPSAMSHGPGRGDVKSRSNGMSFGTSPCPPPMPDTTSPPPPAYSNSSVPYSFPQPFAAAQLPPNRSMFHYNQAYRPTFTAPYQTFPTGDSNFPAYTIPYVPFIYSSHYPPRTTTTPTQPGCYNCGAPNHVGSECTSQNIEEITQKKTYQVEYTAASMPDNSDK